ncbi:MAG: NAD(P)H-hydrate dehydratase [Kiritimatiellia bacterium]
MRAVTAEQMRAIDRQAIAGGVSGATLMDRAGLGLAHGIRQLCSARGLLHPGLCMLAGKGNNGGDVFAAAYHLYRHFPDIRIVMLADPELLRGETRWHYERVKDLVACCFVVGPDVWDAVSGYGCVDLVVDGLLGTGFSGEPREPIAGAIRAINRMRREGAMVVAVDIPSGMCADTGSATGDAVVADVTFTMGLPKRGMLLPAALAFVGSVHVVDIGVPEEVLVAVCGGESGSDASDQYARLEPGVPGVAQSQLIDSSDVRGWLPPRRRLSHKGDYGRILVVGGAPGFSGAVAMAALAACRSGAGLVHVLTPARVADRVASLVPEAMVHAGTMHADGGLCAAAWDDLAAKMFDAILLGPGLTNHPDGLGLLQAVWHSTVPVLVLDADALTLLAENRRLFAARKTGALVLTPHPGEAGRLLGMDTARVQSDRFAAVQLLVQQYHCVAVLKGAGTLVANDKSCYINLTGNPGMATGGSGDVLGGMVAALCGQGVGAMDAACAAVYVHGVAGDLVGLYSSQIGVTAMGMLGMLPKAFGWVLGR